MAYVYHGGVHTHAAKNRAELSANEYETLVVFSAQITVAVTDGDGGNAGGLLCHPVAAVAHGFAGLYIVDVADSGLDSHDGFDRPGGRSCTHAVVAVKGKARAHHVKVAFGVGERACRARAMANLGAESFGFQNVDQACKALNLNFGLRVPRHVGGSQVREHAFEVQVLEA